MDRLHPQLENSPGRTFATGSDRPFLTVSSAKGDYVHAIQR
jgi:hypothetical protein